MKKTRGDVENIRFLTRHQKSQNLQQSQKISLFRDRLQCRLEKNNYWCFDLNALDDLIDCTLWKKRQEILREILSASSPIRFKYFLPKAIEDSMSPTMQIRLILLSFVQILENKSNSIHSISHQCFGRSFFFQFHTSDSFDEEKIPCQKSNVECSNMNVWNTTLMIIITGFVLGVHHRYIHSLINLQSKRTKSNSNRDQESFIFH